MVRCPACDHAFPAGTATCPRDGTAIRPARAPGPPFPASAGARLAHGLARRPWLAAALAVTVGVGGVAGLRGAWSGGREALLGARGYRDLEQARRGRLPRVAGLAAVEGPADAVAPSGVPAAAWQAELWSMRSLHRLEREEPRVVARSRGGAGRLRVDGTTRTVVGGVGLGWLVAPQLVRRASERDRVALGVPGTAGELLYAERRLVPGETVFVLGCADGARIVACPGSAVYLARSEHDLRMSLDGLIMRGAVQALAGGALGSIGLLLAYALALVAASPGRGAP